MQLGHDLMDVLQSKNVTWRFKVEIQKTFFDR